MAGSPVAPSSGSRIADALRPRSIAMRMAASTASAASAVMVRRMSDPAANRVRGVVDPPPR